MRVRIGEAERLARVRSADSGIAWRDGDGVVKKRGPSAGWPGVPGSQAVAQKLMSCLILFACLSAWSR